MSDQPRSAGPFYQSLDVLEFMVYWECALRTGVNPSGPPQHYRLPEQGGTENDGAALKLLRACCTDYWDGVKVIQPFLNSPPDFLRPILARMHAIVAAACLAAARAAVLDGPAAGVNATGAAPAGQTLPTSGESTPATATPTPATQEEAAALRAAQAPGDRGHVSAPAAVSKAGSPLSANDLAKILQRPVDAVDSFLRRYREKYPDCCITTEGRRRNEPKYLYRAADVLPALREHFPE
jgi:hypothetical protein